MSEQAKTPAKGSRMNLYVRSIIFDLVLVLVIATCLTLTVSYGFNSAADLRGNIVFVAVVTAILLVPLYAGAFSKRALLPCAAIYVVLAVVVVAAITFISPDQAALFADGQVNDSDANYTIFGIVVVVVPLIVYLLGRRTWGVALLLFATALTCGAIQFLYRDWISEQPGMAIAVIAYAAVVALFVVQGYRQGVMRARHAKKAAFGMAFAYGLGTTVVCTAVGIGLFFLIIPGLGLYTFDAKPFKDYYQKPVIEFDGAYEQEMVIDPDLGSSVVNEELQDTSSDAEGKASEQENAEAGGGFDIAQAMMDTLNPDNWNSALDAVRYDMPMSLKFLLAFVVIALIVGIILLRRFMRERRLKKLEGRPYYERVVFLYDFFIKKFHLLKVRKSPSTTPIEFAIDTSSELAGFANNPSKTSFLTVTLVYQRACYGMRNVSEEDYAQVLDYYRSFFKNAKARMSNLKWALWGFWRI